MAAFPDLSISTQSIQNALHLAIYYQRPILVWWLLANGAYLGEKHILRGMDINARIRHHTILLPTGDPKRKNVIFELLSDPSPPKYVRRLGRIAICHAGLHLKRRGLSEIICAGGPHQVISINNYHQLSTLKASITASNEPTWLLRVRNGVWDVMGPNQKLERPPLARQAGLRWFHFPKNEMQFVEDLMTRISADRGLKHKHHRPLAHFVRESSIPIPAGGKKLYMKPQCVIKRHMRGKLGEGTSKGLSQLAGTQDPVKLTLNNGSIPGLPGDNVAICLYMPYISWMQWRPTVSGFTSQTPQAAAAHDSMTLDQYYYVSLADTSDRDNDQVMGRYIRRERVRDPSVDSEMKKTRESPLLKQAKDPQRSDAAKAEGESSSQILAVNQLRLWILDDRTMITCTPKEPDSSEKTFLEQVLGKLNPHSNNLTVTPELAAWMVISTAVSFFNRRQIRILGTEKSPLDVFQESIRFVRNSEADLFKRFQASFGNTDTAETELLKEVKDICDELNILKSLVEDQEVVWNQAMKILGGDYSNSFGNDKPLEVKREIMGMIHEAEVVQKAIDTLLDLKQKQANLTEAKFARQQAHDTAKQAQETAKQTDTIVVFTVVTIVFVGYHTHLRYQLAGLRLIAYNVLIQLLLSFLTSLFALNISNFPHKGDDVAYQGEWIFPILFGVSAVVSGFFMTVAFQANSLKAHLAGGWGHLISQTKKKLTRRDPKSTSEDEKV
ncbi:hypothetical protein BJX66DRAFT_345275 [Aspergillus keveii]|uniref:Ankyrin repeat protein n=1 Tax=Aspergillus keveii TaxID=714993 RepID=A0ABR4FIL7_9EURO